MQQKVEPIDKVIAIHPHLLQKFMRHKKDFANLLALYTFYLYHANRQKTNSILATDEFTKNGLNWALDRVKRVKKLLKELGVIVVQQKGYYSYIKLAYIYTKNKIDMLLGKDNTKDEKKESTKPKVEEQKEEKKVEKVKPKREEKPKEEKKATKVEAPKKSIFAKVLEENHLKYEKIKEIIDYINGNKDKFNFKRFNQLALAKWIGYCHRNKIAYNNNSIKGWIEKIQLKPSIEQLDAVNQAIENGWKNFYMPSLNDSKYQKYFGRHLKVDNIILNNLIDVEYLKDGRFNYVFMGKHITIDMTIDELFKRHEYIKPDSKAKQNFKDRFLDLVNSKRC